MPPKHNFLNTFKLELLLEELEVLLVSKENSKLLTITTLNLLIWMNSVKLCMISELDLMLNKSPPPSVSSIEMAVEKFLSMSS
jgi:hypothetical protein